MIDANATAAPSDDDTEDTASDDAAEVTRAHHRWAQGRDHLSGWRIEAKECYGFVAGHQWDSEDLDYMKEQGRIPVTFNRTGPVVDAISGYEINGRQEVTYIPREQGDVAPNQIMNAAGKWFREESQADDEESDAFRDALICGLGWLEQRIDYDAEPQGKPATDRKDPLTMVYDPAARKPNLVDRNWQVEGCWWPLAKAKAMWPAAAFVGPVDRGSDVNEEGGEPSDREDDRWYRQDPNGQNTAGKTSARVFILRHQWRESTGAWLVANPSTNQVEVVPDAAWKMLSEKAKQTDQPDAQLPKATRVAKYVYHQSFVCGDDLLERGDSPCPTQFTINPITGRRDRNTNTWYGVVRPMMDPQRWANKWLSQTLHNMNSAVKGGVISEVGVAEDGVAIEEKLAQPGWHIKVKKGALQNGAIKFFTPQDMSAITGETWRLTEFAIASMRDATGVNVELLGLADRDQPGVIEQARKKSAMTILAPLFDALRRYRKAAGEVMLYYIQNSLSDGRLIKIVGDEGARYVPLMKQAAREYDVIIDEAPYTANQQEAVFGSLMQVAPLAAKMGVSPPPEIIDYIPGLPQQLREKWKQQATAPNPEAEARKHLEAGQAIAEIDKTAAQAEAARAKAFKDAMGVPMDIGQMFMQVMQTMQQFAQQAGIQMPQGGPPPMPQAPPPGAMPGQLPPMVQ